ncbi:envelope integrity protein Cei [Haloechinothrix sp. YIM 98757]|uniref:Envelope integrity protein Cei n=1 Tax=Haloechinothrix aidingensis TaxID=2752311 RepID=A0A838A9Y5_9PSEU|nr:envelope integrity protein Cei [Haloechinothrix aidingensis]MBA0125721.1 envelope integrity protein Cei [Haloechinothrix aidingensis]
MFRVRRARPYRRYRPVPALVVFTLLGLVSGYIWISVLTGDANIDQAVRCEPRASELSDEELESVGHDALDHVTPLPPDKISVQVLNAGSVRGQAMLTTDTLRKMGFTEAGQPANDAIYADESANCRGQLRYGGNGERAARTLSLLVPCFELVRDGREDASVDFVIGSGFGNILARPEAHTALEQLAEFSARQAGTGDNELSAGQAEPDIDEELLSEARSASC